MSVSFLDQLTRCQPDPQQLVRAQQQQSIRRPSSDEAFSVTDKSKTLTSLVQVRKSPDDKFIGEDINPVTGEVYNAFPDRFRHIRFHVCRSITGKLFLLPQKLTANSPWNRSMALVIEEGRKHPITIASDPDRQQYIASPADVTISSEVEEAEVKALFESVFSGLIIDRTDHPLLTQVRPASVWES